jgi:adenosylmethionine-8-amino-7-oxononanoate aminotransferase
LAWLTATDRRHVWHPYSRSPAPVDPLVVRSAEGVRLHLADGRVLIDGMSSWWCAVHGYRNPALDAALLEQRDQMAHVMFGGLTHAPAIELARRLVELAPPGLERVFFADSGSVAVEVAIKMCLQFWRTRGSSSKTRFLCLRGGYHGDTTGAMALCDPETGMHSLFTDYLPQHRFAERPPSGFSNPVDSRYLDELEDLFEREHAQLAGVVIEPVLQGAGGMHVYSPLYVSQLRRLCDEYGVLLVADEIATGFGRTGEYFACDHAGVNPDVMCIGKALTGGYMTLAATLCTDEIAATIGRSAPRALMHGPTFMANPLACAVSLASLDLLEGTWRPAVERIARRLECGLAPARDVWGVRDVRVLAGVGVVELDDEVDVRSATEAATEAGIWLRPFGNLIYAMPPYISSEVEIDAIARAMVLAAKAGARTGTPARAHGTVVDPGVGRPPAASRGSS